MKLVTTALLSLISLNTIAQIALPYSTGFDDAQQQNGWQAFKIGAPQPSVINEWSYNTVQPYSPTQSLYHGYPVGGQTYTDNWFVSPSFNIPEGGKLDTIYNAFGGFGLPNELDTIAVYLLIGSPNPSQASEKILLLDYRGNLYNNNREWVYNGNIALPPRNQSAHLAIRYYTINNWLDVKFDNIHISGNATTSIKPINHAHNITLHPNPTTDNININTDLDFNKYSIFNMMGSKVMEGSKTKTIPTMHLTPGNYTLHLNDANNKVHSQIFIKR